MCINSFLKFSVSPPSPRRRPPFFSPPTFLQQQRAKELFNVQRFEATQDENGAVKAQNLRRKASIEKANHCCCKGSIRIVLVDQSSVIVDIWRRLVSPFVLQKLLGFLLIRQEE
ncbi:hypothetical protein Dimus_027313 [Dionaea muscipula]